MGVSFSTLVKGEEISFDGLEGRVIAVDAYNTLYQFLSSIRDRFTGEPLRDSKGRVTSQLSGLFYRTSKLLESGVKPVFVFDGKPPDFKRATIAARSHVRQQAEEKWKDAVKAGDTEKVRLYAQGAMKLTEGMVSESKELLGLMGVPWLQAPSEGEAQATRLVKDGKAWAVASQDWDSLMFGAERMVKNLTVSGRKKVPRKEKWVEVKPELIELSSVLNALGISHDQLILLGMLIGTDYNPGGVKGIGPKTALKLVKEHPEPGRLFDAVEWEAEARPEEIFAFFKSPPAEEMDIPAVRLDPQGLADFLEDHDFSRERIESGLKKLAEAQKGKSQKGLSGFFGK